MLVYWMLTWNSDSRIIARLWVPSRTESNGSRWLRDNQLRKHPTRLKLNAFKAIQELSKYLIIVCLKYLGKEHNFDAYSQDEIQYLGAPYDYGIYLKWLNRSIVSHYYVYFWLRICIALRTIRICHRSYDPYNLRSWGRLYRSKSGFQRGIKISDSSFITASFSNMIFIKIMIVGWFIWTQRFIQMFS